MLHKLFEKTTALHKDKPALYLGSQVMTYEQLNSKSNQLAHELIKNGALCGDRVAILMDRSFEMIISILATLKSGCAYVPVDPEYPTSLIEYLIRDCSPETILTKSKITPHKQTYGTAKKVYVDEINETNICNPDLHINDNAMAYIIYTSGSGGDPKGVMVGHENVTGLLNAVCINFVPSDVWTLFHSISFDFSVWELFGAILSGGGLVIVPDDIRQNFRKFRRLLIESNVTVLNQTPSAFYSLQAEELKHDSNELSLKYIIFGGEKLNPVYLKEWRDRYQETKLINMYGITETTVHTTYKELKDEDLISNTSNIGQALPHLKIHLLDENLNPVPAGETGEIFIEGIGLAKGYINNPELTKKKFFKIKHISNNMLYRSGDFGRHLFNGDIEYVGREDNQVKIRGHRIELEEIETHINRCDGIMQSIVTAFDINETDKALKAFYVSDATIDFKKILDSLAAKLPHYMLPVSFTRVENFALTVNGKIDRKKVLDCLEVKTEDTSSHIAAFDNLTCTQKRIFQVIVSILNENFLENISIHSTLANCFDSITFIKVVVTLEVEFNFQFEDEMLIMTKFPIMKTLVEYVESKIISNCPLRQIH